MLRVVIPLIVGWFVMNRPACPPASDTNEPVGNAIRQAMWPILLVAMGLAWHLAHVHGAPIAIDAMYVVALAVSCWWIWVQLCEQSPHKAKMVLLLNAALVALVVYQTARVSIFASCMLSIVLIWLLFAEQLQLPHISIQLPRISVEAPRINVE